MAESSPPAAPKPEPPTEKGVEELLAELNKTPLFMTDLEEDNADLEALKALAYEGTRAEIAENFKSQGNDCVQTKRWTDAREFYTRGLAVLRGQAGIKGPLDEPQGAAVIDIDAEAAKEAKLDEVLCVNRALCNIELKNYRSAIIDCSKALQLNPRNTKAYYRTALACFHLKKYDIAAKACVQARLLDGSTPAILTLSENITTASNAEQKANAEKAKRLQREKVHKMALATGLKARGMHVTGSLDTPVDMQDADARIALEDPADAASVLRLPVLLVYPLAAQTELLKAVRETETLGDWLKQVLPAPWDGEEVEYGQDKVVLYMDTPRGGLVKAGKRVLLGEIVGNGKVEIANGMIKCYIVPKHRAEEYIAERRRRRGGSS